MMKGTVKFFNEQKGFGFINGDDKKSYFVHFSNIQAEGFKTLDEGQIVEFEPGEGEKGAVALSVNPL